MTDAAAPAFPAEAAEWIRENAWPPHMRKIYAQRPGYYTACACQYTGGACMSGDKPGRHSRCHLGVPLPRPETVIVGRDQVVAAFAEPYRHPSVSATGWHPTSLAQVWLADRTCAWSCPCECGHPGPEPAHAQHPGPVEDEPEPEPEPRRARPSAAEAAWIRENAWRPHMRRLYERLPSSFTLCSCQYGSGSCRWSGQHHECDRPVPLPGYETYIRDKHGRGLSFAEPFRHATPYPGGWVASSTAQVWLADRTCREVCGCGCNHPGHPGAPYSPARRPPATPLVEEAPAAPQVRTMTGAEAAWVREHVWTESMRRVETQTWPGYFTRCECERVACYQCDRGVHEQCQAVPRQDREGMIADRTGVHPACFAEPYQHVTRDGAPKATTVAQVWLADRICTWSCRCGCRGTRAMSPAEASWVRMNAWTPAARQFWGGDLDWLTSCACQRPVTACCKKGGRRRDCPGSSPYPLPESQIIGRRGEGLFLPEPYEHPTATGAGLHRRREPMVWLADRTCRWTCPCECHARPPAASSAPLALPGFEDLPAPARRRRPRPRAAARAAAPLPEPLLTDDDLAAACHPREIPGQ